uniref:Chromatin elongation factor SPT5 n=1 Tax=Mycena chlorophos TaxID=658473 RepID=A0ABQ0M786_MYCCL|nr:predicted protein [Mycena chlorophos]
MRVLQPSFRGTRLLNRRAPQWQMPHLFAQHATLKQFLFNADLPEQNNRSPSVTMLADYCQHLTGIEELAQELVADFEYDSTPPSHPPKLGKMLSQRDCSRTASPNGVFKVQNDKQGFGDGGPGFGDVACTDWASSSSQEVDFAHVSACEKQGIHEGVARPGWFSLSTPLCGSTIESRSGLAQTTTRAQNQGSGPRLQGGFHWRRLDEDVADSDTELHAGQWLLIEDEQHFLARLDGDRVVRLQVVHRVRVRTSVEGEYIRPHAPDLVAQLVSDPWDGDVRVVDRSLVRAHFSEEVLRIEVGETVAQTQGPMPVVGRVVGVQTGGDRWSALVKDERTAKEVLYGAEELQRHFAHGTRVRVVHGAYRGLQGVVSRRIVLGGSAGTIPSGFGGLEILLDKDAKVKAEERKKVQVTCGQVAAIPSTLDTIVGPPTLQKQVGDEWLCDQRLVGKRLDVQIVDAIRGLEQGYIELEARLRPKDRSTNSLRRVPVTLNDGSVQAVKPGCLKPARFCLNAAGFIRPMSEIPTRVVVIGPDWYGDEADTGEYAVVVPSESEEGRLTVRFRREKDEPQRKKVFPLSSLCRSTNEDGKRTRATRAKLKPARPSVHSFAVVYDLDEPVWSWILSQNVCATPAPVPHLP